MPKPAEPQPTKKNVTHGGMVIMRQQNRAWLLGLGLVGLLVGLTGPVRAEAPVIALSNSYYGNTWRHEMVESFQAAAEQAKKDGKISNFIILNGDGSANQQMSQMSDLILQHVDAIVIDAASETALNGIIGKACAVGIKVLSFDSIVSAPCAYKLNFDFKKFNTDLTNWIAHAVNGKGNVIVVRGVKGSAPDAEMYAAQVAALKAFPEMKVVATVYGQATDSMAQTAVANVLPSLAHIDAVLDQGGEYGIAQAFQQAGGAYADHPPVIAGGGGSTSFLHWWADQNKKNGYSTVAMYSMPSIGGASVWLTLGILKGAKAPNYMIMPAAKVTNEDLQKYANTLPGRIISPLYTEAWVQQHLLPSS
jgi:ribose transport system substrate-binding protein